MGDTLSIGYLIGELIFGFFLGGALGLPGSYLAYRGSEKYESLIDVYKWEPWLVAALAYVAVEVYFSVLGFLTLLGLVSPSIVSFLVTYYKVNKTS